MNEKRAGTSRSARPSSSAITPPKQFRHGSFLTTISAAATSSPRAAPVFHRNGSTQGDYKKADTTDELAAMCGIDPVGLRDTLDRFNPNARQGVDPEFHTGEGAYNQYLGDPKWKPNNCLAPIEKGPFYASAVYPGDVGTCGGILTDENARVLKASGETIPISTRREMPRRV